MNILIELHKEYGSFDSTGALGPNPGLSDTGLPILSIHTVNRMHELLGCIHRCEMFDYDLYGLIEEELPLLLSGARDAEYTASIIQDKVTIYLNE